MLNTDSSNLCSFNNETFISKITVVQNIILPVTLNMITCAM